MSLPANNNDANNNDANNNNNNNDANYDYFLTIKMAQILKRLRKAGLVVTREPYNWNSQQKYTFLYEMIMMMYPERSLRIYGYRHTMRQSLIEMTQDWGLLNIDILQETKHKAHLAENVYCYGQTFTGEISQFPPITQSLPPIVPSAGSNNPSTSSTTTIPGINTTSSASTSFASILPTTPPMTTLPVSTNQRIQQLTTPSTISSFSSSHINMGINSQQVRERQRRRQQNRVEEYRQSQLNDDNDEFVSSSRKKKKLRQMTSNTNNNFTNYVLSESPINDPELPSQFSRSLVNDTDDDDDDDDDEDDDNDDEDDDDDDEDNDENINNDDNLIDAPISDLAGLFIVFLYIFLYTLHLH